MKFFLKALQNVKDFDDAVEECKAPKTSKPTVPPQYNVPPMPPAKPAKTNPPNVGSSVQKHCPYKTPCGWCSKWDKKCDRSIDVPKKGKDDDADYYLSYRALKAIVNKEIQMIKVTSTFKEYLERRYINFGFIDRQLWPDSYPVFEFMGVPVVVDDGIKEPYYQIITY